MNYEYPPLGGEAANATAYILAEYAKMPDLFEIKKRLKSPLIFDGQLLYDPQKMHETGLNIFQSEKESKKIIFFSTNDSKQFGSEK